MRAQLSWNHYKLLMALDKQEIIEYYIELASNNNLSYRQLRERIKSKEYERLPDKTKNKLINNTKLEVQDLVKNPIIIKNPNNIEIISEKVLKELGEGFCYIDQEYKLKIGNTYNYIDLLLFNIKYNCYVVIELKITELNKNHIGQIQVYMNYINNNLKTIYQENTIGLIICKKDNEYVVRYSSDPRIFSSTYNLI